MCITAPCDIKEASSYKLFSNLDLTQAKINFFNNKYVSCSATSDIGLAGGREQEWEQILENISQEYIKQTIPHQDVEEMGEQGYVKGKLDVEKLKNPYILAPSEYSTKQELFDAIKQWWIFKRRKNKNTVKKRIPMAKRMSNHPVFPINWNELNPSQIIAYLEYREYKEGAGKNAIRNEWDTINMFAKAYGINTESWGYIPPSKPPAKVKIIPLPNTTHNIIHHKYSKDKYTNALYQYILMHGFIIGWRPSEIVIQKLSDVNIEEGYMIITETKKHSQLRQIFPEIDLMNNLKRKCLKNWIEKWRPKVENQYSKDFLYLQPNGKPYTVKTT
jgi:integrase